MIFCTRGRKDRQEKAGEAWLFCFDNRMAITRLLYALLWNTRFTLVVPVIHVHHMAWLYKLFDDWRWGEIGGYLCCITCHVWICAKQRNGDGSFLFPLTIYHTNLSPWSTYPKDNDVSAMKSTLDSLSLSFPSHMVQMLLCNDTCILCTLLHALCTCFS